MIWTSDMASEKELHALTATSYPVTAMLRTYGRQVTTARRLARYRRSLAPEPTPAADEEARRLREAKRRDLVGRVAAEIVENCLVTGSDSPIVDDIKAELEAEIGAPLLFTYPPEELEMRIFQVESAGPVAVAGEARTRLIRRLWELALEKVDETML
jgi:hypothetical protein